MMMLDELVVMDNGDVQLRIIPSDDVSTEPECLLIYPLGTPLWDGISVHVLRSIARRLGLRSGIQGIVHGGDDVHTLRTSDGEFMEVTARSHPDIVRIIQKAAENAGRLAMLSSNALPAGRSGTGRPAFHFKANRLWRESRQRPERFLPHPLPPRKNGRDAFLATQLNSVRPSRRPSALVVEAPNTRRRPN